MIMHKINVFCSTYRSFHGVVHKYPFGVKWLSLTKALSPFKNKNRLILGLLPMIPTVLAQSIEEEKNAKGINPKGDSKKEEKSYAAADEQTPWERVKAIYEIDEFGNRSKEMIITLQSTFVAAFVGFIYGGVQRSRVAFVDFMERNQATIFDNHLDAKRKLQNHVTIHFGKGAFQWAWRMTAFTGGFMLLFMSLHAYRGTTSLIDYTVSGAVIGALMRIKLGVPGVVVGGGLGGVLSLLCGMANQSLLSLSGKSLDEVLSAQYKIDRNRNRTFEEIERKDFERSGQVPKVVFDMLKEREHRDEDTK